MHRTDTVIIGAGQAGLAVSACLTAVGRDHVVLERGRVAERWRTQSWDSLRLLTPNWATRLPGWSYRGAHPDGFMHHTEVIDFFARYARSFGAPVHEGRTVERVEAHGDGYRVVTDSETWFARNVVIATGATNTPYVPTAARGVSDTVHQLTPARYRRAADLVEGGVLVVGASASGVQVAHELARAGRHVVVAVGGHTRGVRRYRGRDLWWWLEHTGRNDKLLEEVGDPARAARQPSLQLVGGEPPVDVDLRSLQSLGVTLVGRLVSADGRRLHLADDLRSTTTAADGRFRALLRDLDAFAERHRIDDLDDPEPVAPVQLPANPITSLDLRAMGINTIVWATGYRREYSWLRVPIVGEDGELIQRGGVTPAPGLYVVGLRFQTRRNSNFIDGVRHDARTVVDHLVGRASPTRLAV